MSDEPLITAAEAAEFLKLPSVRAFYAWRRRHPVPSRVDGRGLRFFKSDLLHVRPPQQKPAAAMTREDIRALAEQHAQGAVH